MFIFGGVGRETCYSCVTTPSADEDENVADIKCKKMFNKLQFAEMSFNFFF